MALKKLLLLIPLLGGVSSADNYTLSTKYLDSTLKYNVKDTGRELEAELEFPSKAVAILLGYTHDLDIGSLSFNLEHSMYSNTQLGTDTDWYQDEVSVYSESDTKLDKYYKLSIDYSSSLSKKILMAIELYHENWQMTWSDTKQTNYYNDTYSEISGETVKYEQNLNGAKFKLGYENNLFGMPWNIFIGYDLAYSQTKDQHLIRSFYTKSQDWMNGYYLDTSMNVINYNSSILNLKASYRNIKGDADMNFYNESGENYMVLPAKYETVVSSFELEFIYMF